MVALPAPAALAAAPHPSLRAMALQLSDLPAGARITGESFSRSSDFVGDYTRNFEFSGRRVGDFAPLFAENEVELAHSSADAGLWLLGVSIALTTAQTEVARAIAGQLGSGNTHIRARDIHFGPPRTPHVGDGTIAEQFTIRIRKLPVPVVVAFMQVNRVVVTLVVATRPRVPARVADVIPFLRAIAAHTTQTLLPHGTVPPALTGTAAVGETLSASPGIWDLATAPRRYGYQWERCPAALTGCVALPGATGSSYNVALADRGAVVRVQVTATNAVGPAIAFSSPTAVVP